MDIKPKIKQFSFVIFIVFVSHALLFTQIIPYLTEIGYSVTQRGYVLAFYAAVSMVGQIASGFLSDKYHSVKRFFIYMTLIILGVGLFAFNFDQANYAFHFFMISTVAAGTRIAANLYETWILEVDGLFHEFGKIRMFGSLGWALSSLVAGILVQHSGFAPLGYISGVLSCVVIFYSFKLEDAHKESSGHLKLKDMGKLFQNKKYTLLIVVYTLSYFAFNADSITAVEFIYALGGTPQDVGLKWFVQAIAEMPMMFLVGKLLLKYKGKRLMIFCSVVIGLRFVLYSFSTNVSSVLAMALLQILTFPFLLVTQKDLIYREVPAHLRSSGQMVAVSLTSGMSAIITPLASAALIEATSIRMTLTIFGAVMLIPILLMCLYKPSSTHTI